MTIVDALVDVLRQQILDGEWAPGTSVPEVEVARRFDVSRPTAKSAVSALVRDGLLRQRANHAPYVPALSGDDLKDLFFVRAPLETAIVQHLCRAESLDGLAKAAEQIQRLRALPDGATASAFVAADLGFHLALAAATGSLRMQRTYAILVGEIHLTMLQTRHALGRGRIVREHEKILGAVRRRDPSGAATLAEQHLAGALTALTR